MKVWRALEAFDSSRSRLSVERYVCSCVKNQEKDLLKRRRRGEVFFADVLGDAPSGAEHVDRFEGQYLAVDAEVVYEEVEQELPLIPSTLTELEREVVALLYLDFTRREAQRRSACRAPKWSGWRGASERRWPIGLPAPRLLPLVSRLDLDRDDHQRDVAGAPQAALGPRPQLASSCGTRCCAAKKSYGGRVDARSRRRATVSPLVSRSSRLAHN